MAEDNPTLETFSDCYSEMCNQVIKAIFGVAMGNPALAYALAANAEARFRALNHYNLAHNLLAAEKAESEAANATPNDPKLTDSTPAAPEGV